MHKQIQDNALIRQNLELIENERREIAYELHDDIGQTLTAIRTAAQLMYRQSEGRQTHPVAKNIVALTDEMYVTMQRLLHRLHPSVLEKFGLADSLEDLVVFVKENMQLACLLEIEGDAGKLDHDLQLAVYRIIQEALTNAVRHGQATAAQIKLSIHSDALRVLVFNNGAALSGSLDELIHEKNSGIGLLGIKHRVQAWQGEIALENIDKGVKLTCSMPMGA